MKIQNLLFTTAVAAILIFAIGFSVDAADQTKEFKLLYDSEDGPVEAAFAITGAALTEEDGYTRIVSRVTTRFGKEFDVSDASFEVMLERDPKGRVELTVSGGADTTYTAAVDDYGYSADFGPDGRFLTFRTPKGGLIKLMDDVETVAIFEPSKPWAGFPLHRMALAGVETILNDDRRGAFSPIYQMTAAESVWSSREGAPWEDDGLLEFAVFLWLLNEIQMDAAGEDGGGVKPPRDGDDPRDTPPPVSCETSRTAVAELTSANFNGLGLVLDCEAGKVDVSAKCDTQGTLEADSNATVLQEITPSPKGCPGDIGMHVGVTAKGTAKVEISTGSRCRPNDSDDTATAVKCTGSYSPIAVELNGSSATSSGTEGESQVDASLKICATIPPSYRTGGTNKGKITGSRCD